MTFQFKTQLKNISDPSVWRRLRVPGRFTFLRHEPKPDAAKIKMTEIFTQSKQKFAYIYYFGDDWTHQITLEKITDEKLPRAECIAGAGACPPEDGGGPGIMTA